MRIERPSREKSAHLDDGLVAELERVERRPRGTHTSAPVSLAAATAGIQACRLASATNCATAPGHASGSPSGSPEASMTPDVTRYATQDLPLGDQTTLLSPRRAK